MNARLLIFILVFAIGSAAEVRAQEASSAESLFAQARFEEAQRAFEAILADQNSTPQQIALAHLYLASLLLMDGEETAASVHIAASAAIDSSLALPPGSPPQLGSLRAGVVAAQPNGGLQLSLVAPTCPSAGAPFSVEATATGAPHGVVSSVSIRCRSEQRVVMSPQEAGLTSSVSFPLDSMREGDEIQCEARALASSGAALRAESTTITVCAEPPPESVSIQPETPADEALIAPRTDENGSGRRRRRSPWVWIGVAGGTAAAIAAVVLAIVLTRPPDQYKIGPIEIEDP